MQSFGVPGAFSSGSYFSLTRLEQDCVDKSRMSCLLPVAGLTVSACTPRDLLSLKHYWWASRRDAPQRRLRVFPLFRRASGNGDRRKQNVKVTMMEVERRRADRLSASSRKTSLVLRLCLPPLCEHRNACGESWGDVRGQLRRTLDDERRFFARSRRMTAHGEASCIFQYECIRPTLPMAAYLTPKSVDGDPDDVRPG